MKPVKLVKRITFDISDDLAFKVNQLKISGSKVAATLFEWYVNDYSKHAGKEIMLSSIAAEVATLEAEVKGMEIKKKLLENLKQEMSVLQDELFNHKEDLEYQELIGTLNKKIIGQHYDLEIIEKKYAETIRLLKAINPEFDIKTHITKVRLLKADIDGSKLSTIKKNVEPPKLK